EADQIPTLFARKSIHVRWFITLQAVAVMVLCKCVRERASEAEPANREFGMTLILELTPELEAQLRQEASRHGSSTSEYALRLLSSALAHGVPGEPTLEEL